MRAGGVAFVPEDALAIAAVPQLSALENAVVGQGARYARAGGLALDWPAARADVARAFARLGFTVPSLDAPLATLSGGNVQRAVLARELAHAPRLIVALNPTRGLDARSAAATHRALLEARQAGAAVLLISEDLDELRALADRLVVLFRGRIVGAGRRGDLGVEEIGRLMTGTAVAETSPRSGAAGRASAALLVIGLALASSRCCSSCSASNPLRAYADIFASTLGDSYGFSETLVKMIPLLLTALAVAVPSRIWLINVGGEGQLYVGALCATWAALNLAALAARGHCSPSWRCSASPAAARGPPSPGCCARGAGPARRSPPCC